MFENLSERLERSFKILKGEGKITEINVAETVKDIRKALLDADVSYKVAKDFCNRVKDKAMGQNVLTAVKPQQMMVKIVHDELADFMGSGRSYDLALIAKFANREDLAVYADHPEHVKVKQYIHKVLVNGISVDFED